MVSSGSGSLAGDERGPTDIFLRDFQLVSRTIRYCLEAQCTACSVTSGPIPSPGRVVMLRSIEGFYCASVHDGKGLCVLRPTVAADQTGYTPQR